MSVLRDANVKQGKAWPSENQSAFALILRVFFFFFSANMPHYVWGFFNLCIFWLSLVWFAFFFFLNVSNFINHTGESH